MRRLAAHLAPVLLATIAHLAPAVAADIAADIAAEPDAGAGERGAAVATRLALAPAPVAVQVREPVARESRLAHGGAMAVIVAADSRVDTIALGELRKLFLGKSRRLPDGSLAKLAKLSDLADEFNRRALGKSTAQVEKIWSGLRFSGRSRPPREFDSAEAVIRFVRESRGAIGFVPVESIDARVKSILHIRGL